MEVDSPSTACSKSKMFVLTTAEQILQIKTNTKRHRSSVAMFVRTSVVIPLGIRGVPR